MDGIAAIEQITRNCYRSFAVIDGAELLDGSGIYGVMSHVPVPFFNGIATTNITEADVPEVLEIVRAKRCPFRWWLGPSTRPQGLAPILEAHGLTHTYDAPGMAADLTTVDLDVPVPADVRIQRVDDLTPWFEVFVPVFSRTAAEAALWRRAYEQCGLGEDAPWTHYVAFIDGKPVATTSLLLDGELAGIYSVGTLAEARGRGIGAAVTREAMRFARDRGATQAALQSSELGSSVYRRLGFVEYCNLRLYEWR